MRHVVCTLIAAVWAVCAAASVQAAMTVDTVRSALEARDFEQLEALLAAAHADALEARDFGDLRKVHSVLFGVAHRERHAAMEAWFEVTNGSIYAATALGWAHYDRAYLARGDLYWGATPRSSRAAYQVELENARFYAQHVFAQDKTYAPGLDVVLVLQRGQGTTAVSPLLRRLLRLSPDRTSLGNAFTALDPRWGAPRSAKQSLCMQVHGEIEDMDLRACLLMAEYVDEGDGFVRGLILSELERRDEPYLDYIRLNAYLNEWQGRPEARQEVIRIHRKMAQPGMSFFWYDRRLQQIDSLFPNPLYTIEAKRAYYDIARARVEDDPQNYRVLLPVIDYVLDEQPFGSREENLAAAWSYWEDALDFGSGNYIVWERGGSLAFNEFGSLALEQRWPFFVNQMALRANEPSVVRGVLGQLVMMHKTATDDQWRPYVPDGSPAPDYRMAEEALICPMIRVARLYTNSCRASPGQPGCNIGGWGVDHPDTVAKIAADHSGCLWEKTASLEELQFEAIAYEDVKGVIGR